MSAPSKDPGEGPSGAPPAPGGPGVPWPVAASLQTASVFTCLVLCLCLLCVSSKTLVMGCRVHLDEPGQLHLKILNLFTSSKALFPNKVTCVGFGDQDVNYLFGDQHSTQYRVISHFQSLMSAREPGIGSRAWAGLLDQVTYGGSSPRGKARGAG